MVPGLMRHDRTSSGVARRRLTRSWGRGLRARARPVPARSLFNLSRSLRPSLMRVVFQWPRILPSLSRNWSGAGRRPESSRIWSPEWEPSLGPVPQMVFIPWMDSFSTCQRPHGLAVHLNYIEPRHVPLLKASGATVVYCPRASAFFGHPHGGAPAHAWREMLAAGIPVALGTDGRPCLLGEGVAAERLSILDDILHLQRTCGVRLEEWLPMATLHGAVSLGVSANLVSFQPGGTPGILALKLAPDDTPLLDEMAPIQWISSSPMSSEAD